MTVKTITEKELFAEFLQTTIPVYNSDGVLHERVSPETLLNIDASYLTLDMTPDSDDDEPDCTLDYTEVELTQAIHNIQLVRKSFVAYMDKRHVSGTVGHDAVYSNIG